MSKKKSDGFYRDENGKLAFPPDYPSAVRTYVSCKGFDYSVPKDYTFYYGGTRYFLGDPEAPNVDKSVQGPSNASHRTDIRHQFSKTGPSEGFKQKLSSMKKFYKGNTINDW